jgi:hypothetical protein
VGIKSDLLRAPGYTVSTNTQMICESAVAVMASSVREVATRCQEHSCEAFSFFTVGGFDTAHLSGMAFLCREGGPVRVLRGVYGWVSGVAPSHSDLVASLLSEHVKMVDDGALVTQTA